jgi:hypothetical protein
MTDGRLVSGLIYESEAQSQLGIITHMTTPLLILSLVLLFLGFFSSRYIAERSMKLLSSEEKLKLLDSFSRLRVFGALPLLVIFFSFFGIGYLPQRMMWPAYFAAWALVAVYFVVVHRVVFRRMSELGINAEYQAAHCKARWLSYGGFAAFFVLNTLSPFISK